MTISNVIADYSGYDDVPATRQILKEFVVMGYGEKIYVLFSKKLPWQVQMQSYASEFANKTGFKEELVQYVFECIEFGLGWLETEPSFVQDGSHETKKDITEDLTNVDLDKQLILMQKEYISMLNGLIVVPKGKLYKKSGYYPAKALSELWVVEHKIDIISSALGQDNSEWCKAEKDKVLLQYQQTKSNQLGAVFAKVVLPLLMVAIAVTEGVMYIASSNELKEYDSFMAIGNEAIADGNYEDAVVAFESASCEYEGSFAKRSKIKNAKIKQLMAITPIFNNTIANAKEMSSAGKFADAKEALKELANYPLSNEMKLSLDNERNILEEEISKAISDGKNTMLMIISTKGRKLDAKTMEKLSELLKVAPEDYWLNFVLIKSK